MTDAYVGPRGQLAKLFAPSRWHPFKRRAWFRFMRDLPEGASHWASYRPDESWFLAEAERCADLITSDLSRDLPDGYVFIRNWDGYGSRPSVEVLNESGECDV